MVSITWELAFHFVWRNTGPHTRTTPSFELKSIFTFRQRIRRKVIFLSCVSAILFTGGVPMWSLPLNPLVSHRWNGVSACPHHTIQGRSSPPALPPSPSPLPQTSSNLLNLDITIQGPDPCPPDMFTLIVYCRQVGSWHSTKMISCRTHQLTWRAVK